MNRKDISHCGPQTSVCLKGYVTKGEHKIRSARRCFTQVSDGTTV